ncbi:MAG: universal stress protein [Hyphomicrobiales bacterium]|nr:universal stress protein [Hyphomicrobiales bacterium]
MTKNILVATDGSDLAGKAVAYATGLAKDLGAKLTVVTVSESWSPLEIANKAQAGHFKAIEEFEQHASDIAAKVLKEASDIAQRAGAAAETLHIPDATPAEGIIQAAAKQGSDLIVMGSHGRRGLSRLVLGSQALEVMSLSKVPVLIFK